MLLLSAFVAATAQQQEPSEAEDAHTVVIDSFWKGWYLQAGLDMTLQNPYGFDFSETFPKGKTFGLDGAIGKWFSPEIGLRALKLGEWLSAFSQSSLGVGGSCWSQWQEYG